jgi:S1-C subfamily serine protease
MRILAIVVALALCPCGPLLADDAPASSAPPTPSALGVHVQKAAGDGVHFSHGQGIYIGGGLVLTAAHVVNYDPAHPGVTIRLDGALVRGEVIFDSLQKDTDLALIKLEASALSAKRRQQAYVAVCARNAAPERKVLVVQELDVKQSVTLDAPLRTIGKDGTNILMMPVRPGNSGTGVFDQESGCLLGVVLQEAGGALDGRRLDDVAIFSPSSSIAPFLEDFLKRRPLIGGEDR